MLTTTKIIHIWGNLLWNAHLSRLYMNMSIFWDMILCSCIYLTLITSQKKVIIIVSVKRNSNLTKSYKVTSSSQGILMKDTHQLCCRQQELSVTAVCVNVGGLDSISQYSDSLCAGRSGDRITVEARFSTPIQTSLGPTWHSAQYVYLYLFPGVKWVGNGTDHPPKSGAEVKEDFMYVWILNCVYREKLCNKDREWKHWYLSSWTSAASSPIF